MPPVATPSDVSAWTGVTIPSSREQDVVTCISNAVSWLEQVGSLRSLQKEASPVSVFLDGNRAEGVRFTDLWLPDEVRPVWHTGSDLVVVKEYGTVLTVGIGYSPNTDVMIRGANTDKRVLLYRLGGWYRDEMNIEVSCKCGWDVTPPLPDSGILPAVLPLPASYRQLVVEAAWLLFNSAAWVGKANVSKAGAAVTIEKGLSPMSQQALSVLQGNF